MQPLLGAETLVVYSARKEHLIKPVTDKYTLKTGIKVQLLTDKAASLLARLRAEGSSTPADLLITVDAGNLWHAAQKGVLASIHSKLLQKNIPSHLRDPGGQWYGLSIRARTIAYNTKKVKSSELSTYEDLGNAKWKGRLCLRTSKKVYNQSLVATMIADHKKKSVEQNLRSWVKNLAAPVFSSDTKVLEAIAAGQCDVGIVNTYYFGRLLRKKGGLPLSLFWPNQKDRGVHVNISGAGVTQHSKHKKEATHFLEWLSSPQAQSLFSNLNLEYPANPKVKPAPEVAAWGTFKQDQVNLSKAGELQKEAIKLMDRVGYK
ncbi:MAG: extracellular solute-binding protein [Nitrospiria bacterium]